MRGTAISKGGKFDNGLRLVLSRIGLMFWALLLVMFCGFSGVKASSPLGVDWSVPLAITLALGDGLVWPGPPVLVVDNTGELHVFWAQTGAIFYAHGNGTSWSAPIDIVAGSVSHPQVLIDQRDIFHLFWWEGAVYHSSCPIPLASNPRKWSKPVRVSYVGDTGTPNSAQFGICQDLSGTLHVLYPTSKDVFHTSSSQEGRYWTEPTNVSRILLEQGATDARIVADTQGALHAVWAQAELPSGWPPTGVYYASSTDGGDTWSPPLKLAGDEQGNPAIVATAYNTLEVVWSGNGKAYGEYHCRSDDGGYSWPSPVRVVDDIGMVIVGHPQLLEDNHGGLHWVMGGFHQGLDDIFWSTRPMGSSSWTVPVRVSLPDELPSDESVHYTQELLPSAAIRLGNQLHVVWVRRDYANHRAELLHSYRVINASPLEPVSLVMPATSEDVETQPAPTPAATVLEPSSAMTAVAIGSLSSSSPLRGEVKLSPQAANTIHGYNASFLGGFIVGIAGPSIMGIVAAVLVCSAVVAIQMSRKKG